MKRELYEKVFIHSEEDLPERNDRYFACYERHNEPTQYGYLDFDETLKNQWFIEVKWYLCSVPEVTAKWDGIGINPEEVNPYDIRSVKRARQFRRKNK